MKKYKRYKYRKVDPKISEDMRKLRVEGVTLKNIGKKYGLSVSTVEYHLNPKYKEKVKERTRRYVKNLSKEELAKRNKKWYEKMNRYWVKRYNSDPEFRKYFIEMVKRNFKKRRKGWIKKDLCSRCGMKRKNKKWMLCEKCREASRGASRKRYQAKK